MDKIETILDQYLDYRELKDNEVIKTIILDFIKYVADTKRNNEDK